MDIIGLAIWIIVLLAIGGVVYWFTTKVAIPAPFSYILYAIFAIVAILILANLAGLVGGGNLHIGTGFHSS